MVQKSGIIKRFLAGTHSNQILYLNSVSESEKRRFQKFMFPGDWSNGSTGNATLKSVNITLWFTIYSFHVETVTIHFLVPNSTKNHQKCII